MNLSKEEVRKYLMDYYKNKVDATILLKNIDDLVDEYIDNKRFIERNGNSTRDLPTKEDMKYWFQDRPKDTEVQVDDGTYEKLFEINIDTICLENKVANEVFLGLYNFNFSQDTIIPKTILGLIKLNKIAEYSPNKKTKQHAKNILSNIAIVGSIRFYHLERSPYLTESQITKIINSFRKNLFIVDELNNEEYKDKIIDGVIYMFDYLNKKSNTNIK